MSRLPERDRGRKTELRLELVPASVLLGEPLVARLRLTDPESDRTCPVDPTDGSLITLRLVDSAGRTVAEADGAARDRRLGLESMPRAAASMPTFTLPAGRTWQWEDDVLAYLDIPDPGDYEVVAFFSFEPGSIEVRSDPVPVTVLAPALRSLDVEVDRVAQPVVHVLEQHELADGTCALATFRSPEAPNTPWYGQRLPETPSSPGRISLAGFETEESLALDYTRWAAWVTGRELMVASYRDRSVGARQRHDLGMELLLLGRPVHREDGAVSVLLFAPQDRGSATLKRLDLDPQGKLISEREWRLEDETALPVAMGCDALGGIYAILSGKDPDRAAPLWLLEVCGAGRPRLLLDQATLEKATGSGGTLLAARVLGKPAHRATEPKLALVGWALREERSPCCWVGSVSLESAKKGVPDWSFACWDLESLVRDEWVRSRTDPIAADACTAPSGELAALVILANGIVLVLGNGPPRPVVRVEPEVAGQVRILPLRTRPAVFFPDAKRGVRYIEV